MAPIHQAQPALDVTPCTKRLPTGKFLAYIEHHTGGLDADGTESFVAGEFDNAASAQAAAVRLMRTFRSSVIVHCEDPHSRS